jgi:hypothetical protein
MSEKSQKAIEENYDASKTPFSWDKLDGLLAYKSSLIVCADILEIHENTIKNHIKKRFGMTFTEYAEKKLSRTKVKLVQKALEMATSGNATMMIFCLKNLCNWSDREEHTVVFDEFNFVSDS